ncbi:MAG: hypothetical protein ABIP93_00235 [Gemmatimonadaceae bacterium]
MTKPRPDWPDEPRPFVAYRPPYAIHQPTRSDSLRVVWGDAMTFIEHTAPAAREKPCFVVMARRWSAESMRSELESWLGEWPTECSIADFDAAVRIGRERFGKPKHDERGARARRNGLDEQVVWFVSLDAAERVLDFLERVPNCTVGALAPVHASVFWSFNLRDLESGVRLPGQGQRFHPQQSSLSLTLQSRSYADLHLILPFAEPNEDVADYVVALQEHAPMWIDPRYFDHMTLAANGPGYERRRLPPDWIGLTLEGRTRLDASRSGITPPTDKLPSNREMTLEDHASGDAAFYANLATVESALREHGAAAVILRGDVTTTSHLATQAARQLGLPVHTVDTWRLTNDEPTVTESVRAVVDGLDWQGGVLVIVLFPLSTPRLADEIVAQAATRTVQGMALPTSLRLVLLTHSLPGDEARSAAEREWEVRQHLIGTKEQRDFLRRQQYRAAQREVRIELLPPSEPIIGKQTGGRL